MLVHHVFEQWCMSLPWLIIPMLPCSFQVETHRNSTNNGVLMTIKWKWCKSGEEDCHSSKHYKQQHVIWCLTAHECHLETWELIQWNHYQVSNTVSMEGSLKSFSWHHSHGRSRLSLSLSLERERERRHSTSTSTQSILLAIDFTFYLPLTSHSTCHWLQGQIRFTSFNKTWLIPHHCSTKVAVTRFVFILTAPGKEVTKCFTYGHLLRMD